MKPTPIAVALGVWTLIACGDGVEAPPEPSRLEVRLVSPFAAEGAAVISLDAAGVDSVVSSGDGVVYTHAAGGRLHVVVVRDEPGPIGFHAFVRDAAAPLGREIVEVAGPDNTLRSSLADYSLQAGR